MQIFFLFGRRLSVYTGRLTEVLRQEVIGFPRSKLYHIFVFTSIIQYTKITRFTLFNTLFNVYFVNIVRKTYRVYPGYKISPVYIWPLKESCGKVGRRFFSKRGVLFVWNEAVKQGVILEADAAAGSPVSVF